ncbi:MAG: rhomboid family intramembrane serine protease [Ostreibacterium sp.]
MKIVGQFFHQSPVTAVFIILSVLISIITWFGHVDSTLLWFIYDKQAILSGQVWRLVTPIFLHFPALGIIFAHLAFNLIWLHLFGVMIERTEGSKFLFWLILVAAVVSNVAQGQMSYFIFGGMSGVVYALLGYLFLWKKLDPRYPINFPEQIAYFLIGFMLLSAIGVFGDGIANTAHIVGFVVGLGFAGAKKILKH